MLAASCYWFLMPLMSSMNPTRRRCLPTPRACPCKRYQTAGPSPSPSPSPSLQTHAQQQWRAVVLQVLQAAAQLFAIGGVHLGEPVLQRQSFLVKVQGACQGGANCTSALSLNTSHQPVPSKACNDSRRSSCRWCRCSRKRSSKGPARAAANCNQSRSVTSGAR